jgi:hypothetical protein
MENDYLSFHLFATELRHLGSRELRQISGTSLQYPEYQYSLWYFYPTLSSE